MIVFPVYRRSDEPTDAELKSGDYPKRRLPWKGLTIAIENEAGHVRRGTNRDGKSWEIRMKFAYGEILRTRGVDGDPVDCFLGPALEDAPTVYVVHARKVNRWDQYDEDKCMLGFMSEEDAKAAFLSCYSDERFLGPVTAMPVAEFIEKVRATKDRPSMIKAILFLKSMVAAYTRRTADGKVVNVGPHSDRRTKRAERHDTQLTLFAKPKHEWRAPALTEDQARHPDRHTPDLFESENEAEYAAEMEKFREASRKFSQVQAEYRDGKVDDTGFMLARVDFGYAQRAADKAEARYVERSRRRKS